MNFHRSAPIALALVAASIFAACGEDEAPETPAAAAAPTQPAEAPAPAVGGSLHVDSWFLGMEDVDVTLGHAFAYPEEDRLRVVLVSDGIGDVDCDHDFRFGEEVEAGQLALRVDTHGMNLDVPFDGQTGTLEHVGYTYYYRREGRDRGTNSGNSARADLDTSLEITRIDDEVVVGTLRIREEITGNFVAEVCD